jgi:ABC-type phosphate/phosphonate transport system substrate-binding protein
VAGRLRFATFLAPRIRPLYELVADELGAELVDGDSFDQFERGELDGGFVCGLPYVRLAQVVEPLAAPVLSGARYGGRPVYYSDVIVQTGSGAGSFADLRGRSFAFNERDSHSGCGVVLHRLAAHGQSDRFFGETQVSGSHRESIRRVAAGEVDAAAIDSQVLAVELREQPDLRERVKTIDALGPSTIQPVVVARRLPEDVRAELRAALVSLRDEPAMAFAGVERFATVGDADYDDIRAMVAACDDAGLTAPRS